MAEWLYEDGIGESRAALVENGIIVSARVVRSDDRPPVGAVLPARLLSRAPNGRVMVESPSRHWKIIVPDVPSGLSVGSNVLVEITREAIPERGRLRPAHGRLVSSDTAPGGGPGLSAHLERSGLPVRRTPRHGPDLLEDAGWSAVVDEARTGEIPFPGGRLLLYLTPAMTLFDVDGTLPPLQLAIAAAEAVARAIVRLDIGGSIGIDFPTLPAKVSRQQVAGVIDGLLPPSFERTALNGFGFMQIVRPRVRASLPELFQGDRQRSAAFDLVRRAMRTPGAGTRTLVCSAPVAVHLDAPTLDTLRAWTGWRHRVREDALAPWNGSVEVEHP